ncbi:hypothetical protein OG786_24245 [Streptomyces sp. NBC_00101]|uniref:hypothetical protein n=1 Tax=Streptomyces sp. NBC_00101 TaxID=2975651 RepID=UPI003254A28A
MAAALTTAGLLIGPPAAAADAAPSPKIDSALLNAVDGGGEATFFVMLKDRADLSSAKKQKSHAARAEAAYGELRAHAKSSQKSLSSFLDEEKVSHEGGDRQAAYEVRTARAEFALRARRPDDALRALSGHTGDAPVLVAWAELLSGRPESALRLARAEVARSERTGERLAEVEARIALGVSLSRLALEREGARELARAETLAGTLPYPAGARRAERARALLREAGRG